MLQIIYTMNNTTNNTVNNNHIKYIYFSTGFFGEAVLKNLLSNNIIPSYIITSPDRPQGRHQIVTSGPIKNIAEENNIPFFQPEKLNTEETLNEIKKNIDNDTLCVVCDYGKILPQDLLDLKGIDFINIHPSLLPTFRGPAPLQNTILENMRNTGITIIQMDNKMDHGPIIAQKEISIEENIWPVSTLELSDILSKESAILLVEVMENYKNKTIKYTEQDHKSATYTHIIEKKEAEIFPDIDSISNIYKKYQAYKHWPEAFYINKDGKRVKIKKMNKDGIQRILIEGKNESDFIGF